MEKKEDFGEYPRVHDFLDGKLSTKSEKEFWIDVAAKREIRALFFILLIERWNEKTLTPQQKDLAVKLYKESTEFRKYYDLYSTVNKPANSAKNIVGKKKSISSNLN